MRPRICQVFFLKNSGPRCGRLGQPAEHVLSENAAVPDRLGGAGPATRAEVAVVLSQSALRAQTAAVDDESARVETTRTRCACHVRNRMDLQLGPRDRYHLGRNLRPNSVVDRDVPEFCCDMCRARTLYSVIGSCKVWPKSASSQATTRLSSGVPASGGRACLQSCSEPAVVHLQPLRQAH
jgi:hypothetical protein